MDSQSVHLICLQYCLLFAKSAKSLKVQKINLEKSKSSNNLISIKTTFYLTSLKVAKSLKNQLKKLKRLYFLNKNFLRIITLRRLFTF